MSLHRPLNSDGIRHTNADSPTHAKHVAARAKAREFDWLPELVSSANPSEEFKLQAVDLSLGNGRYFVGHGEMEAPVDGSVFEKHLSAINWERRWYRGSMRRGEKMCEVRRKRKSPACGEYVVNLAPWQMSFINSELKRWEQAGIQPEARKELLLAFLDPLRETVVAEFKDSTGWDVPGSYLHFDSNKIHTGIIGCRVSENNTLLGSSTQNLGPWSVAQGRITAIGAGDPADARLRENLEKFHNRYGASAQPLDVHLHAALDTKFDELVASMDSEAPKRFEAAKEYYKSWKAKARREAPLRSPSSQKIAWEIVRFLTPLLPREVRSALTIARTVTQVFTVLSTALDAVSLPHDPPQKNPKKQPEKTK